MLQRRPEPNELMNGAEQAYAYAHADFETAHRALVDYLWQVFPDFPATAKVIDLGCGAADIAIRLARHCPQCTVVAIDGAPAMLAHAKSAVLAAGLQDRIVLQCVILSEQNLLSGHYDAVVSNSLLHHLYQPKVLWQTIQLVTKRGAYVFVADLIRPESAAAAKDLTIRYSEREPEILRKDFYNSLLAAFTPDEVRAQLAVAALGHLTVETISDRHMVIYGRV